MGLGPGPGNNPRSRQRTPPGKSLNGDVPLQRHADSDELMNCDDTQTQERNRHCCEETSATTNWVVETSSHRWWNATCCHWEFSMQPGGCEDAKMWRCSQDWQVTIQPQHMLWNATHCRRGPHVVEPKGRSVSSQEAFIHM